MIALNEYDALLLRAARQAVQPETRATMLVKCEEQANALVALLTKIQGITPSGTYLAITIHLVDDARSLAGRLQELKGKVPA